MKIYSHRILILYALSLVSACGSGPLTSQVDEEWNQANNPVIMGYNKLQQTYDYTNILANLPLKAQLSQPGWASHYWPAYRGSVTYRWQAAAEPLKDLFASVANPSAELVAATVEPFYSYGLGEFGNFDLSKLSPTEKYDLLRGDRNFTLTQRERSRWGIMKTVASSPLYQTGFKIPTWYGLCAGLAPATIAYKPVAEVSLPAPSGELIHFAAGDVQGLLSVFLDTVYERDDTQFLAGRCETSFDTIFESYKKGEISSEEYNAAIKASKCSDTNAGSFHIVLANQVGRLDEGFIIDRNRDQEVWNHSVVGYESRVIKEVRPQGKTAPGTKKMILVQTAVFYNSDVEVRIDGRPTYHYGFAPYVYYLELDVKGAIIGGQWYEDSSGALASSVVSKQKVDRPDFLWKRKVPEFKGIFIQLGELYRSAQSAYEKKGYKEPDPVRDMPAQMKQSLNNFWNYGQSL